jgi:hypothetical protein
VLGGNISSSRFSVLGSQLAVRLKRLRKNCLEAEEPGAGWEYKQFPVLSSRFSVGGTAEEAAEKLSRS